MAAQLAATVYVTDPDSHQTVELAAGSSPEPRLAALVPNPAAWVDRKLPRLPRAKTETGPGQDPQSTGDGNDQDGASGGDSDTSPAGDPQAAPAAKKTAAPKRVATKPARGRDAAEQGTSGE
ncbi:hypothetical protein [Streptomyces sp. NPDC060001]|uniref:hypothetical protein n=1 Tax=Streptomyces sp. NPDC060001 TaxID=3347032 RepID=UPI0036C19AE4